LLCFMIMIMINSHASTICLSLDKMLLKNIQFIDS
jgi:hypothetical protein